MRILANRKQLAAAFSLVASVAPTRSPKPILQKVRLQVDLSCDEVDLQATDLEVGMFTWVAGVKIEESGDVMLDPAKFGPILSACKDEEILIETDGGFIVVKGLRSSFRLPSEDPNLFPAVAAFQAVGSFAVGSAYLKKLIRRTSYATDPESTRYALGGALVEAKDGELALIATDGRRLARSVCPVDLGTAIIPTGHVVIPLKAMKLIEKIVDASQDAQVSLTDKSAMVQCGNAYITTRLVEGRFPRYQDVFPAASPQRATIQVGAVRMAAEQSAITTSDESRGVDFAFADGVLTLSSSAADAGSSTIETSIEYTGNAVTLSLDPRYLLDALKTLPDESSATIEIINDKNPLVLKTEDGFAYVVMPLAKDR